MKTLGREVFSDGAAGCEFNLGRLAQKRRRQLLTKCVELSSEVPKVPAVIVESASIAAVTPLDITYKPYLAPEIVSVGRLSDIQLERVNYAGQRHEQRLPDGSRAGFLLTMAPESASSSTRRRHRRQLDSELPTGNLTIRHITDLGLIPLARINDYSPAG